MKRISAFLVGIVLATGLSTGCSKDELEAFQKNDPYPPYNLLKIFDNFPSLKDGVDSLSTQKINYGLGRMLDMGIDMPEFLSLAVELVEAPFLAPMLGELGELLGVLNDDAPAHYDWPGRDHMGFYEEERGGLSQAQRLRGFHGALDQIMDNTDLSGDVLEMAAQVVNYLNTEKTPAEIEDTIGEMTAVRVYQHCMYDDGAGYAVDLQAGDYTTSQLAALGITDKDVSSLEIPIGMKVTLYSSDDFGGQSIELTGSDRCLTDELIVTSPTGSWNDYASSIKVEYDLSTIARLLGKMTMSCDYPMWVDSSYIPAENRHHANSGTYTTNTDLGNAVEGVNGLLKGLSAVASDNDELRFIINDMILYDLPALLNAPDSSTKIKNTVINLSNYFAENEMGSSTYESVADYHNSNPYVNASLKEAVRDMVPNLAKLFIRDDDSAATDDALKIFNNPNSRSPVEELTVSLDRLKTAGIDYTSVSLEPSIKRMLERNGRGRLRSSDGSWSNLSYLDHLVFTIAGSYNFGFLTQLSGDGEEPQSNFNRTHGAATNGIITINDSMYALTSGEVEIFGCPLGMHSYSLALDQRATQGDHVARSSSSFSVDQYGSHKFFLGYDFPTLGLLPAGCAGDAGIPNGGETAVTVNNNQTLSTTGGANDYRTYFPKVADGKGVMNTAQFLMGWLARACWDGGGPYYYSPEKGGASADVTTFDWPGVGNRTVYRYYKANGEVYAYVYKGDPGDVNTWEYFYPHQGHTSENANDVSDNPNDISDVNYQRANRYRPVLESDHFVVSYKPFLDSQKYLAPPMNAGGDNWVDGTSGDDMFHLNQSSNGSRTSANFRFFEKVPEQSASRECRSQEEALYRNLQWFLLEKKFVFTIPMYMKAELGGITLGHSGAFIVIEANGAVGLANARKGDENGHWASDHNNSSKIHLGDVATSNTPDYRDSSRPGDGRILVFVRYLNLALVTISNDFLFNTILGNGYVLPDAVGRNIDPVVRMGFLTADTDGTDENEAYIPSGHADIGVDGTDLWDNRNKFFPLLLAITGTLHEGSSYTKTSSGHNYNYDRSQHKYPLADLLEGVFIPLSKPLMRYYTADNRWVPRVKTESGYDYQYFNPKTSHSSDPVAEQGPYLPREVASNGTTPLRTMLSVLTGNAANETNGLLPILTDNTGLVTRLIAMLQMLGDETYDAEREDIARGLEQVMTAMKVNKSEAIAAGLHKTLDYSKYEWVFNKRNEDIDMEDLLGYEGPFRTTDDWTAVDDSIDVLKQFVGGSRDITPNLVNILNAVLAQPLTEDQVHGLIYTAGKLFARYDQHYDSSGVWEYHGDTPENDALLSVLSTLPQMHDILADGAGGNYGLMMANMDQLLSDHDSFLYYVIENMTTSYGSEQILEDFQNFLQWRIVSDADSPLWRDLALMLDGMAGMVGNQVDLNSLFDYYGFTRN